MFTRGKHPNSLANLKSANKFRKGHIPWNKGLKGTLNSGKTHFKKGFTPWNKGLKNWIIPWNKDKKGLQKAWNKGKPNYEMRGENHPNWKGGKGRHDYQRKRFEVIQWRNRVFRRDNWLCQWCKIPQHNIEAHHIKRWIDYPELRVELNNGITLCVECHKKTKTREEKYEYFFQGLLKKGVNSVELLQEDNTEPANEITQGSLGVCRGQA